MVTPGADARFTAPSMRSNSGAAFPATDGRHLDAADDGHLVDAPLCRGVVGRNLNLDPVSLAAEQVAGLAERRRFRRRAPGVPVDEMMSSLATDRRAFGVRRDVSRSFGQVKNALLAACKTLSKCVDLRLPCSQLFAARRIASRHQLCSRSLTGGSAATLARGTTSPRPLLAMLLLAGRARGLAALARRPGWRAAGQSGGAGRRRAHGDAAEGGRLRRGPKPAGRVVQRPEFEALRAGLLHKVRQGEFGPTHSIEARPGSLRNRN